MKFSVKQLFVLRWWLDNNHADKNGIICDGAVRSGKTFSMSTSFAIWSMSCFNGKSFAFCGRTIASVYRNFLDELLKRLRAENFKINECRSKNYFDMEYRGIKNRYYVFGGKDEGSQALIQGITLAGVMFDEAALMPRSFVEQAAARCSVRESKLWFNCNPENPYHWFKREWIDKASDKRLLYVRFSLNDNPSLSEKIKQRYTGLFSGAFYKRFVLGEWSSVFGLVYPDFCEAVTNGSYHFTRWIVSCDYGTVNPSSFGLWGKADTGEWVRVDEYYFDSRTQGFQRTDEEHYRALKRLVGDRRLDCVIIDPSAASFIECVSRHGEYIPLRAKNDVVTGIRQVSDAIKLDKIKISSVCRDAIREFTLYRWDEKSGTDSPVKENDHAMDDIRYFVSTVLGGRKEDFYCMCAERF